MKNKKIIILVSIIFIAPILILVISGNTSLSASIRNTIGMIGFAIYILAIVYSLWFIRSKKNHNNKK